MYNEHHFIADIREITDTLIQTGLPVHRRRFPATLADTEPRKRYDRSNFIDASQTVLELGHPTTSSIFIGIVTDHDALFEPDRVTILGKPISELPPGRHSLALILFVKVAETDERARRNLNQHILSCNRLGGIMVRLASGRIWFRFSQKAVAKGLTLDGIGRHILGEIHADHQRCEAAEVMFVVGDRADIECLRPVVEKQAQDRNDHYQSALVEKMACETGLDCEQCPETETCKVLRKAVAEVRKKAT